MSLDRGQLDGGSAQVIEAGGITVMPGLVEGHAHLSFGNAVASTDLGDLPREEHTLLTARNAKALLDHGFTSAYSAASAKLRLDIVIRNAIASGQIPGRRLKACGPEITVTFASSSKRHPLLKHRSCGPLSRPDEFPCSALKILRYVEKNSCSSKIIPCSVE